MWNNENNVEMTTVGDIKFNFLDVLPALLFSIQAIVPTTADFGWHL